MGTNLFEGKRILVVDDDDDIRELVAHLLDEEGFTVLTASDGREGYKLIQQQLPDLVLTDVDMPNMNGFELTKKIRENPESRLLPVIHLTGLHKTADRIKGIEAGCDDFISKPFHSDEVLARVRSLLKLSYYRSLLDEKEKFDYLLNNLDVGIAVLRQDLTLHRANHRACALLQIPNPFPAGSFIDHLKARFEFQNAAEDWPQKIQSGTVSFDLVQKDSAASGPIYSIRFQAIRNSAGELDSIVLICQDVTEQRKHDFQKMVFLDLASHKLRTPLFIIQGYLSLIEQELETSPNAEIKKSVDVCTEKSLELKAMIDKILDFIKILNPTVSPAQESLSLDETLPELVRESTKNKSKKIETRVKCHPKNLKVTISRHYLALILDNLIDNAIEFNDKEPAEIQVEAKSNGRSVEFRVSDNGVGIDPVEQQKIFDKFYQIDRWNAGNIRGFGMGLALVKQLVTTFGGEITLESAVGKGTTVIFTLAKADEA